MVTLHILQPLQIKLRGTRKNTMPILQATEKGYYISTKEKSHKNKETHKCKQLYVNLSDCDTIQIGS
jgi:hypothetical protein